MPLASRKDVRDAVLAARGAVGGWTARPAYGRGQILYRLAEVMEARRAELVASLVHSGERAATAPAEVDLSVDLAVHYAGFCDKVQALTSSHDLLSRRGPYFCDPPAAPVGVVAVVAPPRPALLGVVATVLPVVAGGNTCVVVAGDADPLTAVVWSECLATSDVPAGVINVLTGRAAEVAPHLAAHGEIAAIDAWVPSSDLRALVLASAAGDGKIVVPHGASDARRLRLPGSARPRNRIEPFLRARTIWHPDGDLSRREATTAGRRRDGLVERERSVVERARPTMHAVIPRAARGAQIAERARRHPRR